MISRVCAWLRFSSIACFPYDRWLNLCCHSPCSDWTAGAENWWTNHRSAYCRFRWQPYDFFHFLIQVLALTVKNDHRGSIVTFIHVRISAGSSCGYIVKMLLKGTLRFYRQAFKVKQIEVYSLLASHEKRSIWNWSQISITLNTWLSDVSVAPSSQQLWVIVDTQHILVGIRNNQFCQNQFKQNSVIRSYEANLKHEVITDMIL